MNQMTSDAQLQKYTADSTKYLSRRDRATIIEALKIARPKMTTKETAWKINDVIHTMENWETSTD